jgi:FAD/FMN-containing dehydrogenase
MKAITLDGAEFDLTGERLDALRLGVRGPVILPGDASYEDSRTVWNAMIDRHPAAVVRCAGTSDVIGAVKFARDHKLLLCIKGGGHNIAGLAVADGGLMLDLSLMRGVWVDKAQHIARAQGGCLLGDVDRETQLHGLATVLGFVSLTGIAGLTLGGGFGFLTRRWGWTSDNVVGMDVVTAEGNLVRASDRENADLFWGLRGGGGNFGVVTGIDYKVHPLGPEIVGGVVAWPGSEAPRVLDLYRTMCEQAPPELTMVAFLRSAPAAPWLPKDVHGTPIVAIVAIHTGKVDEAEQAVAPIKNFGRPVADILIRRPYAQMQSLFDATQPKGRRYYWKSEYLPRIDPALCEGLIARAATIPSPHTTMILFHIAGALNALPNDHSPVGNRDAAYVLNIGGCWEKSAGDEKNVAWGRDTWNALKGFSTGGNYINFLTEDEGPERVAAALGTAAARLAKVKQQWDPENVFRTNRNIKPAII